MPVRSVRRVVWHQGAPRRGCVGCADPATNNGRYHRRAGQGVWYASNSATGAWAELFRHTLDASPSPFEVRRRLARVRVNVSTVVDLTDQRVLEVLGVHLDDLTADELGTCQDIADLARPAGVRALVVPSAALAGETNLVIFAPYLKAATTLESERVQIMPVTIADHAHRIRPVPEASSDVARLLSDIAAGGRRLVRRLRDLR